MQHSTVYTILFATAVCVACGILVSSSAVSLEERQEVNATLERQQNVLEAAGLRDPGEKLSADEVAKRFERIEPRVIELKTGEPAPEIDPTSFDQLAATRDPERSRPAPPNPSAIPRLPEHALVYLVRGDSGDVDMLVLPIQGLGLWGTLYGFLALDADTTTIRGIAYYRHKETPGLGGEVDNPRWKRLWPGRQAYGEDWEPKIEVIKGQAGPPSEDPYQVDGLSGATITSRGVTNMLNFWLGENGFGPYLQKFRQSEPTTRES